MKKKIAALLLIFTPVFFAFGISSFSKISGKIFKNDGIRPASGVTIELYTLPDKKGKKIIRLISNKNGEFTSNKMIDFSAGLYPVLNFKNIEKQMKFPAKTGNCMLCHTKIKLTAE